MLPTDATSLALVIADGTVTKSTEIEMVWQASADSASTIKEIHTLAGGEEGVVPGRTWVFDASSWADFATWAADHADHVADYASIDLTTMIVQWKVLLRDGDAPSETDCTSFAAAIVDADLPGAMLIASQYFEQDLALDSESDAYLALATLTENASLYAERLDTACLGYKFFSAWDSPTTTASSTDADVSAEASAEASTPPSSAPTPPSEAPEPAWSD